MARRLAWSPEAIEDVEHIAAYIERDSTWYAKAVVAKIVKCAESAADFRIWEDLFRKSATKA